MDNEIKKRGRPSKEKNYNSPFAVRLRELSSGMTQQEIADGVGVSRQNIGQFLLGNNQPDITTLGKLADYFNVSTDYLLCRTDIKTADTTVQNICGYTGLNERAVSLLNEYNKNGIGHLISVLNYLLSTVCTDELFEIRTDKSTLIESIVAYMTAALNTETEYFLIQKDGHVYKAEEDIPDESKWDRQITAASVSSKQIVEKILIDEIVDELKKAGKEYMSQGGSAKK